MGTILFTGANSSLGIPAVKHLLTAYPEFTLVLTVKDPSSTDLNTAGLRDVVSEHPACNASIYQLDLASLAAVRDFAGTISSSIAASKLPRLSAIVCNASYWNLVDKPDLTVDGYDRTFQVGHIAHVSLVLQLLGHFSPDRGRIVLLSSINHIAGKSPLERYKPGLPPDLDNLVHPTAEGDLQGRGIERYSNTKLVITTWMYALNRHLEKHPDLKHITVVAVNPGALVDSRAFRTNVPTSVTNLQRFLLQPFLSILRWAVDPTLRRAAEAGVDIAEYATDKAHPGERGYFALQKQDKSAAESLVEANQEKIWARSVTWAHIKNDDTPLRDICT
jgi:NAD(P)-dependent dehydrogenase (short-subunit alcohol dehydrogenase family)